MGQNQTNYKAYRDTPAKFAFISRHKPTPEQEELARESNILLVPVGDADAFTVSKGWLDEQLPGRNYEFQGVVVVHPAAALRMNKFMDVVVFENEMRSEEGAPPKFFAKALHFWPRQMSRMVL